MDKKVVVELCEHPLTEAVEFCQPVLAGFPATINDCRIKTTMHRAYTLGTKTITLKHLNF
jgi:hypothetical protein